MCKAGCLSNKYSSPWEKGALPSKSSNIIKHAALLRNKYALFPLKLLLLLLHLTFSVTCIQILQYSFQQQENRFKRKAFLEHVFSFKIRYTVHFEIISIYWKKVQYALFLLNQKVCMYLHFFSTRHVFKVNHSCKSGKPKY